MMKGSVEATVSAGPPVSAVVTVVEGFMSG